MRKIEYIAIHCTAGSQEQTVDDLKRIFKQRGWINPGYHYVICPNGKVENLLPIEQISNGVKGYNSKTINIAYIGGIDNKGKGVDNRTLAQKESMFNILVTLKGIFPNAIIQGHRDFSPDLNRNGKIESNEWIKLCPCFNAKDEYRNI